MDCLICSVCISILSSIAYSLDCPSKVTALMIINQATEGVVMEVYGHETGPSELLRPQHHTSALSTIEQEFGKSCLHQMFDVRVCHIQKVFYFWRPAWENKVRPCLRSVITFDQKFVTTLAYSNYIDKSMRPCFDILNLNMAPLNQ